MRVDNEVLNVLSNAETNGNVLKLVGQLDRNLYTRTNKVLEAAGGLVDCYELMDSNFASLVEAKIVCAWQQDFLTVEPNPIYDRVVMNPPFDKQADIKHVMHALKFLKPDGLLVSVMSAGVTFRDNKLTVDFRALIRERGGDIEALPDGSFKESGTGVNTVIVTIPA